MSKTRSAILVIAVLVVALAVGLFVSACGKKKETPAQGGTKSITDILGHDPTGIAKQVMDTGTLVVANDSAYPPQSFKDNNGVLKGFDVDVAKKVGELLGVKIKFENPNWDAIPGGLQVDRYDVSIGSMTINADRLKSMDFSDPYYYTQGQVMIKQGSAPLDTLASLQGKTIGVGTATTYQTFLEALGGVKVQTYATDSDTFPDLTNGRLDGVMTADLTASEAIAAGKPFELTGSPYYYEQLAFAIRKNEADLLAILNYAVQTMHADGSLTAMSKQWYHGFDTTVPFAGATGFDEAIAQLKAGTFPGQ